MFQDNLIFKHIFMHLFFKSSFMFSLHLFLICPGVHVLYNCDDIYRTILFAYRGFLCCFVLIMMSNLHISHSQNVILNKNNVEKFHWTNENVNRLVERWKIFLLKMGKCENVFLVSWNHIFFNDFILFHSLSIESINFLLVVEWFPSKGNHFHSSNNFLNLHFVEGKNLEVKAEQRREENEEKFL